MTPLTFKTAKSAQTFENVLRVATELFRTKGYAGTTMRDLSRESGLGLGALYYYFRSKEELVLRFYEHASRATVEAFRATPNPPKNSADLMVLYTRMKIAHLTPYRALLAVVIKEAIDPTSPLCVFNPASAGILAENVAVFQELVERTGPERGVEALALARGLWMGQMALLTYWLHDRSPEYAATERAIETFGRAIRLSTTLSRVPGFSALRRQVLTIVSALFREGEAANIDTEQEQELQIDRDDLVKKLDAAFGKPDS